MTEFAISKEIEKWTIKNSGFEEKRNYISLSRIYFKPDILIDEYLNGFRADRVGRLKCYKGYQMEKDMLKRMKEIYSDELRTGFEISIENGLFKGHPDFVLWDDPGDVKSVLLDEYLPWDNHVSPKNYYQIQAYMLFMNREKGYLLYESRESGLILALSFAPNLKVQDNIKQKIEEVKLLLKQN